MCIIIILVGAVAERFLRHKLQAGCDSCTEKKNLTTLNCTNDTEKNPIASQRFIKKGIKAVIYAQFLF